MAKPGPKPKVEPADALAVFDGREDRGEPLTASEVADALGCSRRTALNRLHDLADDGRLRSKQVGGRSRVYWTPLDGASDAGEEDTGGSGDGSLASEGLDVDGSLDALDLDAERTEAVRAMHAYLAEQGTARKSDFVNDVYPDHSAGYGSAGGWWNALGKEALASLPGVEKPAEGRPNWRFLEKEHS